MPRLHLLRFVVQAKDVKPGQGEVLFGTAQAQKIIYQHQHPADCDNARFLVHKSQGSGIGSLLHQVLLEPGLFLGLFLGPLLRGFKCSVLVLTCSDCVPVVRLDPSRSFLGRLLRGYNCSVFVLTCSGCVPVVWLDPSINIQYLSHLAAARWEAL